MYNIIMIGWGRESFRPLYSTPLGRYTEVALDMDTDMDIDAVSYLPTLPYHTCIHAYIYGWKGKVELMKNKLPQLICDSCLVYSFRSRT